MRPHGIVLTFALIAEVDVHCDVEEELDAITPLPIVGLLSIYGSSSYDSAILDIASQASTDRDGSPVDSPKENLEFWAEAAAARELPPDAYLKSGLQAISWKGRQSGEAQQRKFPEVKILSDFSDVQLEYTGRSSLRSLEQLAQINYQSWLINPAEVELGSLLFEDEFGGVHEGRWRGTQASIRVLRLRAGENGMTHETSKDLLGDLAVPLRHPGLLLHMASCRPEAVTGAMMMIHEQASHTHLGLWACAGHEGASLKCCVKWTREVCCALSFLHGDRQPIVLSTLKPRRVLVDTEGHIKLLDVELEVALRKHGLLPSLSAEDSDVFTPPEGADADKPSANVYSAGVIALALLIARTPTAADIEACRAGKRVTGAAKKAGEVLKLVAEMLRECPLERAGALDVVHRLRHVEAALDDCQARPRGDCHIM